MIGGDLKVKWYATAIKKYTVIQGRSSRTEYWMFQLINSLILILLLVLGMIEEAIITLFVLYYVFTVIPQITITVRRLHDIGRSGWWYLLTFVPFGNIALFIYTVLPSESHANVHGPEPHVQDIAS